MSAGTMLLTLAAILAFCGLLQRVLDRMYLTDRQALMIIGLMLIGTFLPNIPLGKMQISLAGAVIPLGVCIFLLIKADKVSERLHAIIGAMLTAGTIYALSTLLPAEPEILLVDPLWLYGLCGGVIAWLLGRSRRNAFICGVSGVILADIATGLIAALQGYNVQIVLGGGGIADVAVVSGVVSVLLCEILGEAIERLARHMQSGRVRS